jgi:predicted aspartyl protease
LAEAVFRYQIERSNIFDRIKRPRILIHIYSKVFREWITIEDVLADTGADISILPKSLGIVLVGKISNRRRYKLTGMVSHTFVYLHELRTRINGREIRGLYAISSNDDMPPTLGRMGALDKFEVTFRKGKSLSIK